MRKFVSFLLPFILTFPLRAKPKQTLYVAVLQTTNYVVGAANAPSGLHRYDGDSLWTHTGWRNVRNFGISVDNSNKKFIFLACGNGAMRSLDGGRSWRITTDWRMTEVLDVVINPLNSENVYIATAYGVWRSENRGDSWIAANDGLKPTFVQTIEADRKIKDRVLVGGEGGLYKSNDGTKTWSRIGPDNVSVRDIHQSIKTPNLWLAGTEDKGVLTSRDNGNTWQFVSGHIADETIYAVAVDPINPDRMAAAGYQTGIYLSVDGGKTWNQHKEGLPVLDVHGLIFDLEKPGRIWVGTLGAGFYYSDDLCKTWVYTGLKSADIWDITIVED